MKCKVFLIADSEGVTRMTRRWPSLGREEIGVQLTITIPDGAFKSPVLAASIDVREEATIQPTVDIEVSE